MSSISVFRVVRVVRMGRRLGRAATRPEDVADPIMAFHMSRTAEYISALPLPLIGALVGIMSLAAVAAATSPFIQEGQFLPPDPSRGIAYADQVRQNLLKRIYGPQEGDRIWQSEFSSRTIEVDLRSKYP